MIENLEDPVEGVPGLGVTVSVCLAELHQLHGEKTGSTSLIAAADAQLLKAKRAGRNQVLPEPVILATS